jgi:hypothetical protein
VSATANWRGFLRRVNMPDLIGGLLLIGVGLIFAIGALDFGVMGREGRLGPGGMPFFAGAALTFFGLGVLASAFRARPDHAVGEPGPVASARKGPAAHTEPAPRTEASEDEPAGGLSRALVATGEESPAAEVDRPGRALAVFGLTLLAAIASLYIGFIIGFALLIVVILVVMERERLWLSALVAISAGVIAHFLFADFLRIPLPDGVLF